MVTIQLITLDRYEITKEVVLDNLKKTGYPYELLVVDNGSNDKRVIELIKPLADCLVLNSKNEGIYKAHNKMFSMASGEFIVKMDNDIVLPQNWLKKLVEANKNVPNSGVSGIHTVQKLPEIVNINGFSVRPTPFVYGTMFINREVFNKVGYFNEAYSPYGLGDSEYLYRVNKSGFINYYLVDDIGEHKGITPEKEYEYRKNKDNSLIKNIKIHKFFMDYYNKTQDYYLPNNNQFLIRK